MTTGPIPAKVSSISDSDLMLRLSGGDTRALGILYQRHGHPVTNLLLRLNSKMSREQAEDLTQETFLTLVETADRYSEQGRLRSWLYGIAIRKARNARRLSWFQKRAILHPMPDGDDPGLDRFAHGSASPDDQASSRQRLDLALGQLSPKLREVLVLHVIEGLSGDAIAEILDIKTSAVWVRLHRARKIMETALFDADQPRGEK
jgi:RNA polymerase sigma-70 factor (ECF subfamily)